MLLILITQVLIVIVFGCGLYSATWYWYRFWIRLYNDKCTTVDAFYPQEKHEKNAYILIIKNILSTYNCQKELLILEKNVRIHSSNLRIILEI